MTTQHRIQDGNGSSVNTSTVFDVIIVGGSFAGLSAALALGRARRSVLVVDAGLPCNHMVQEAHNLLTQDGEDPNLLRARAKDELTHYDTVRLLNGNVKSIGGREGAFVVATEERTWNARRILLATGVKDLTPPIQGLAECWGRTVLHCPFCHGFEVRDEALGVLGAGGAGYEFARLIHNWSDRLTLFTNGPAELSDPQCEELTAHGVVIREEPIAQLNHEAGHVTHVQLEGGERVALRALFVRMPFRIPEELIHPLGCALAESGHVQVDELKRTSVPGIYAAGDLTTPMRSLAAAIAAGNVAGAAITHAFAHDWQ